MKTFRKLRNQYIIFIATVIVTIISSQVIIQYDLSQQNEDAQLINLAGKQGLLEQRLLKLTLYLQRDITNQSTVFRERLKSLQKISTEWRNAHYALLEGNQELKLQKGHSIKIDSLLKRNTPLLEEMYQACQSIIKSPTKEAIDNAIVILEQNELPYMHTMAATVDRYQLEAEKKLRSMKKAEIVLATMAIIILMMEFIFIFIPIFNKLRNNNLKLTKLSNNLLLSNNELRAREEEIKSNLEQISTLQKNLEEREQHFRQLVEDASDMIYELNESGKFSYVNPIMERTCGFTKEELEHKYYWDLVHANKKEEVISFYNKQRKDLVEFSYLELPILSKEGEIVWIGQNVHMLYSEKWVIKVRVVARDITTLVKAREAMAQSEEKFRSLAEFSSMAIFQMNIEGTTVYRNNRCSEIFGTPNFGFEKEGIESIYEEDKVIVIEAWKKILSEHTDFHLEYRITNPMGGVRWVNTLISKFKDPQGKPIGYIGNITDVTELKHAQQRIIESERLYRELLEHSRDLITLTSLEGFYIYVSNSVDNFLGYSTRELLETSLYDYVHPEDREVLISQFKSAQQGKSNQNIEYRLRRKDGEYFWVDSHIQAVADRNGNVIYYQTTSRDITLRKDYELAMKDAKARAEEATLAKSQFLSVMSHEIRTPMNAIIGLTNLLLQEQPRPDQTESLSLLKFSGENLLTIINDILDFSKIEAGKITLEYIDLDLHLLLKNIIQVLNQRAEEKGIKLHYRIADNVPNVIKGDPVRIGQILTNLVSNAIKFTERGYVKLTVTMEGFENDKYKIRFCVQDTGIGIGPDKLDHIFERFTQASSDITRKFGGTGLGLSITKKLLNLMDTDIQVESSIGQGSEFHFILKTVRGNLKEIQSITEAESINAFEKRAVKILLVEDNKINQIVATNFLHKWNIQVDLANNGKEAVEKIVSKDYQLVLMDLQMPELDGYEAARIIRAMDEAYFKNVPIIALTASAMMDVKGKVLETGMNDFITKPFHPEELQAKIIQYVLIRDEDSDSKRTQTSKKLDLYSDGDNEFKKEIAALIIKNIEELQQSLHQSVQLENVEYFTLTCHKVKAALSMVDDEDLTNTIEHIKRSFQAKSLALREKHIQHFNMHCKNIILSMDQEIKNINSGLGLRTEGI